MKRISEMKQAYQIANPIPIKMDISFLKPLAYWYEYMTVEQRNNLPPRVANALDSIYMIMGGRL